MNTLTQTFKRVKLKGKSGVIIREQYLRDDIPCYSPLCQQCISDKTVPYKTSQLLTDATHYAIPCLDTIENYLEVLESPELKGFIILQSVTLKIIQNYGHKMCNRLVSICKDIRRRSVMFLNEICKDANVQRQASDSFEDWLNKCCVSAAEFYAKHLNGAIPIILITENVEVYKSLIKHDAVKVCNLKEYLESMWSNATSVMELFESLNLALTAGTVKDLSRTYDNYLTPDILEAGIKSGRFLRGHLRVNKHNASQEAFVTSSKASVKDSGDIFICGMIDRNRAIHGDEVVVEMLPREQWKSRCLKLVDNPYDSKSDGPETDSSSDSVVLPTGKVVGVLEKCWRNYVATLPEEEEDSGSAVRNKERILVVPYDYRIPKIRIVTKQADNIRNKRIVVRINSWDKESQYPNGHIVQTLGDIGDLETEVQTLLIEHDAFVGEFPQNLVKELPVSTVENPWTLEAGEIAKRKDLRESHLIFSIDPKGCEDVDDALSIKQLPNGCLELGVHIADVTYFVQSLSMVDLEAQSRSTTVYLPDRRYDMLPHILSGNLCSLLGSVDRYAVSILWKLDSNYAVEDVWYGRTIIKSKYKLCYEAAQDILLGTTADKMILEIPELQGLDDHSLEVRFKELKFSLSKLYHVANVIRSNRLGAGGLELNSINMKFEIDHSLSSAVTEVKSAKELAIHKTVAECMIFANHWVAKKISDAFPNQAVLRRHPNPREVDLAELQTLATSRGFSLNIHSNKELAESLEKAVDSSDPCVNQIIRILATQTMNQATYCCTGVFTLPECYHYGLGLDRYTHFTSPIRRYADVMVHRLLLAAVGQTNMEVAYDSTEIERLCEHMNIKHKAAQDLEKDAQQLFLAFYFEDLNKEENSPPTLVDAVIYAIRANGALVFIPKYGIKGAVCLCNREKRVAYVREEVEWMEGKLTGEEFSLTVETNVGKQRYRIFDHITVCIKVQKSRSHQRRILLDLVQKKPFTPDLNEAKNEKPDLNLFRKEPTSYDNKREDINNAAERPSDFNLYEYLNKIKALTISDIT